MDDQAKSAQAGVLARPWAFWALVAAATLIGAALRLHGLGEPSLWVDEFFSIARAGTEPMHWTNAFGYQPTRLSLWLAGADLDHIGLANISQWQSLGVTERAARTGACWVGVLTVPTLALLARPVLGSAVAGIASLLLAILPYHLYWSQMARYYTTEFLFANSFVLMLARGLQTGGRAWFAGAAIAALLAFAAHFTAVFIVGACFAAVSLAWLARVPLPHLRTGAVTLALTTAACALLIVAKELAVPEPATLTSFAEQSWDPPVQTLVLGTILRVEPVVVVVALAWLGVSLLRRDPLPILMGVVALGVPLGVLALKGIFPVGQRYFFASLYPWMVLAAMWCAETDRRLASGGLALAGVAAAAAVAVSVGFGAFGYTRDGAGARERWRDAFDYVRRNEQPGDPVFVHHGGFQAHYYLERQVSDLPKNSDARALAPGSWIVYRSRGTDGRPPLGPPVEMKERYEIPSKPWSWVVYVLHVPRA